MNDATASPFGGTNAEFAARDAAHVKAVLAARPQGFATSAPQHPPAVALAGLRRVAAIETPQLTPNTPATEAPRFAMVDPAELLIDETYQRGLSNRSIKLIRRMVGGWDWRRFKPPVVARTPAGLEVIDGQHTAIGAASHPGIKQIPVMIVAAAAQADRAAAFVGHNLERLNLTPMQMHASAVAAGERGALAVNLACLEAGVVILKTPRSSGYSAGETLAVGAIDALVKRRKPEAAARALKVLVDAGCAPVSANWIKAVDLVLYGADYVEAQIDPQDLSALIQAGAEGLEKEAALFAQAHKVVTWKALASVTFARCRKRRRRGGDA